jgi:uncharacterized protein YerC
MTYYLSNKNLFVSSEFEDAYYDSTLRYSLQHVAFIGDISTENIIEALEKSLQICRLAGINSKHHYKQIYIFDTEIGTLSIDWRMSKIGFNLMITQIPLLNENKALWLWKLLAESG